MKQRLLFALLMLFTSMGFVKAADEVTVTSNGTKALTIKLDVAATPLAPSVTEVTFSSDNKTVTIAQGYTTQVKLTTDATNVSLDGNIESLSVSGSKVKTLTLGATNYVKSLTVSSSALTTLTCSGLGMETLVLTGASALETLDASNNKLTAVTGLPVSLTSLNLSKNNFSTLTVTSLTALKTLDMSNNALTKAFDVTGLPLTTLKLSDNKILGTVTGVPATGCTATYGTQTLTTKSSGGVFDAVDANKGFRVKTLIKDAGISAIPDPTYSAITWQVKSSDAYVEDANKTAHQQSSWADEYRFYDNTTKEFVSGTYQCTLTVDGRTYRISELKVGPAKFTLSWLQPVNATAMTVSVNGAAATSGTADNVKQGDKVLFSVTPATGYEKVTYTIEGMVPANSAQQAPYTGQTFECIVKGLYKTEAEPVAPKVTAVVSGKGHIVKYETTQQVGGTFSVQKLSGGVATPLQSGEAVATGDKLIVAIKPNTGYGFNLTLNNTDKTADVKKDISTGNYTYTVEITNADFADVATISMAVIFTNASVATTVKVDGKDLDKTNTTPAYVVDQTVTIQVGATKNEITSATAIQLAPKTNHQAVFTLKTVTNEIYRLKDLTINGGELVSINQDPVTTDNSMKYTVVFTTKTSAVCLSITTKKVQTASILPTYDAGSSTDQTQVYDGKAKPYLFDTDPANLNEHVKVTYKETTGSVDLGEVAPVNAGSYKATLEFKETDYYAPHTTNGMKTDQVLKIAQAPLTIATLPTVKVTNAAQYEVTGGVVKFGDKEIKGSFEVVKTSDFISVLTTPEAANVGKSHIIGVLFTPANALDVANFVKPSATVNVLVANSELKTYKITMKTANPANYGIQWLNGTQVVDINAATFAAGTQLTAVVTYPKGTKDVALKVTSMISTTTATEDVASSVDGKVVYDVVINEASDFKIEAGTGYAYEVKLNVLKKDYTGEPLGYDKVSSTIDNLTIWDKDKTNVTASKTASVVITYKDASGKVIAKPIDAGSYTVCVNIPADKATGYVEYNHEFAGAFVVEKIQPTVYKWPAASVIAKGQAISQSELTEGAANIPGTFGWSDGTIKHDVAGNYKHEVTFTPTTEYGKNYLVVKTRGGEDLTGTIPDNQWVKVEVSELQIITFAPTEGTMIVTNQLGQTLLTGSAVNKGDVLTIAVTPREGLELKSLTVNGTAISGTYTVGESSVAIEATFAVKTPDPVEPSDPVIDPNSQYAVKLPSKNAVRGVVINKSGVNAVTKDKSFSFTLSSLAADASKIVVKANGTELKPSATGVYTMDKVSANTDVTITLAAPTKLNVSVETTTKNAKGYLVGKVQVEGSADGVCYYGDELTLVAYPESGVTFAGWSDDATAKNQLRILTLMKDVAIKPIFSGVPTGIESVATAQLFGSDGCLVIRGIGEAKLTLVGMDGRIQKHAISGDSRIPLPAGIYGVILEDGIETVRTKVIVK